MSGFAAAVTGCGGGGGAAGVTANSAGIVPVPAPAPAPAPTPTPTPPPVPTLNGVTIDQAEMEIRALITPESEWISRARQLQTDVTVTSPAEFQTAVNALFDTAANPQVMGQNHRIQLAWNGPASVAGGANARVNVGRVYSTASHLESGGSITIAAAPGYRPAFSNTMYIFAQGIIVQGVGFTRATAQGELQTAIAGVLLANGAAQPLEPVVHFQDCYFGHASGLGTLGNFSSAALAAPDPEVLANGVSTQGQSRFLSFQDCRFWGNANSAKIVSRALRMDGCDFSAMIVDAIDLFGHAFNSGYYSLAWISRSTFRDRVDTWDGRNNHADGIQYCGPMDIHKGVRLLVTDCIMHLAHSFAGDPGLGGGTSGLMGSYNDSLDNQFVIRRCTMLNSTPHAVRFYSPQASRPSFIDQSTFARAGRTPSSFAPDQQPEQDYVVGITGAPGSIPATGNWLLVSNSIAFNIFDTTGAIFETVPVDPRPKAEAAQRPETVFAGRNFSRGGAPANGIPQKFGYDLPNERGSQTAFVSDIWANFATAAAQAQMGMPDLRALHWKA